MDKILLFSKELAYRFIDDTNLPLTYISEENFMYQLDFYEKKYNSYTKYKELSDLIHEYFDSDIQKFLNYYYTTRETIISTLKNSKNYCDFNNMDMCRFKVPSCQSGNKSLSKNIYNENNDNKVFLSIDLKKANFQALKFVDKNIVLDYDNYEDFILHFTPYNYFKDSKYLRQVVFGQLNPSRHITVEKYMTYLILDYYVNTFNYGELVSFSNDEIVFHIADTRQVVNILSDLNNIEEKIKEELNFEVSVNLFNLNCIYLHSYKKERPVVTFYVINNLSTGKNKLKCVPAMFSMIIHALVFNYGIKEEHMHFNYEGIDCVFNDMFYLKEKY